ncbi:hypothetical protein ACWOAH_04950 [Vagococcus vulneris]|uniref:Uncharacterized protein n=1 Tax=Vagococcus vulneris TaxID=1977869 RepID=A0A429ZZY3_9ENTE|nr:hypothetical protein [Vagococcus vulneris]RST99577.1 hypothetical protein CBF37_04415 [Vagococcus vulneris]
MTTNKNFISIKTSKSNNQHTLIIYKIYALHHNADMFDLVSDHIQLAACAVFNEDNELLMSCGPENISTFNHELAMLLKQFFGPHNKTLTDGQPEFVALHEKTTLPDVLAPLLDK